jgi:hypothetical protein
MPKHTGKPVSSLDMKPMDEDTKKRFLDALREWEEVGRALADAARKSERLTEADFSIRINAR